MAKKRQFKTDAEILEEVKLIGSRILASENMQRTKGFIQHGTISCYEHCLAVACLSLKLAYKSKKKYDTSSLVRGALLHDFYLYDWHENDKSHRLHGFHHALTALKNAYREFELNKIEMDIIAKHMFPLNLKLPRYRESRLVCIADKIISTRETVSGFITFFTQFT